MSYSVTARLSPSMVPASSGAPTVPPSRSAAARRPSKAYCGPASASSDFRRGTSTVTVPASVDAGPTVCSPCSCTSPAEASTATLPMRPDTMPPRSAMRLPPASARRLVSPRPIVVKPRPALTDRSPLRRRTSANPLAVSASARFQRPSMTRSERTGCFSPVKVSISSSTWPTCRPSRLPCVRMRPWSQSRLSMASVALSSSSRVAPSRTRWSATSNCAGAASRRFTVLRSSSVRMVPFQPSLPFQAPCPASASCSGRRFRVPAALTSKTWLACVPLRVASSVPRLACGPR
ncbi:hypothetical protein D9M70_479650 [compost metagenome]